MEQESADVTDLEEKNWTSRSRRKKKEVQSIVEEKNSFLFFFYWGISFVLLLTEPLKHQVYFRQENTQIHA